jgi:hypothetical protein
MKVALSVDPVSSRMTSFKTSKGLLLNWFEMSCWNWKLLHVTRSWLWLCFQVCLVVPLLRFWLEVDLDVRTDWSSLVKSSGFLSLSTYVPSFSWRFWMALLTCHCSRGIVFCILHFVLRWPFLPQQQ